MSAPAPTPSIRHATAIVRFLYDGVVYGTETVVVEGGDSDELTEAALRSADDSPYARCDDRHTREVHFITICTVSHNQTFGRSSRVPFDIRDPDA